MNACDTGNGDEQVQRASFLHSPIGSGNEDDCKSSAKSRDECSGSFPDKMIEEAGCSIFWTGRAEWIQVFEFF
ncbi:hypothetical protein [Paenibacillus dendritiformis]|uniref:hypothetical protein n=1 Tax=Paenibacillus dendritiformis TaxID=130049 RepID=UPI00387E1AA1